jgi:hypothetical protein
MTNWEKVVSGIGGRDPLEQPKNVRYEIPNEDGTKREVSKEEFDRWDKEQYEKFKQEEAARKQAEASQQ